MISLVLLSPIAQILVQYAHTLPQRALPRRLLGSVGRRVRSHDGSWCKSPSGSFDGVFSLLSFYHNYHCSTRSILTNRARLSHPAGYKITQGSILLQGGKRDNLAFSPPLCSYC